MLPLTSQVTQNCKTAVFHLKSHFAWRKSATKFFCVKTVSDKVVRPIYPCKNDWWGTSPSMWKFAGYLPIPFQNDDFQSIFSGNASAVTASEKSSISTNGKSTTCFQMSRTRIVYVDLKPPKVALRHKVSKI